MYVAIQLDLAKYRVVGRSTCRFVLSANNFKLGVAKTIHINFSAAAIDQLSSSSPSQMVVEELKKEFLWMTYSRRGSGVISELLQYC